MQNVDRNKFNSSKANSIIVVDLASALNIVYNIMEKKMHQLTQSDH